MGASTEIMKYQVLPALAANIAGVRHGQMFIAEEAFPPVKVDAEEFRRELDDNAGLLDVPNMERAMDADTAEVDMDQDFTDEVLTEISIKTKIDKRKIRAYEHRVGVGGSGMSAEERVVARRAMKLEKIVQINKEKRAAAIGFGTAYYDSGLQSTAIDFDAVDLVGTFEAARWGVHSAYGVIPDTAIFGKIALQQALSNGLLTDRIEGGSTPADPAMIGLDTLAKMLRVNRILIGSAVSQTKAAPGAAGVSTSLWREDAAALIYTGVDLQDPILKTLDQDNDVYPVFGRTYYANVPETAVRFLVAQWDSLNGKIRYVEVTEYADPKQIMKAGYLWLNTDQN